MSRRRPPAQRPKSKALEVRSATAVETRNQIDDYFTNIWAPAWAQNFGYTNTYAHMRVTETTNTLQGYMAALRGCPPAYAAQMVRALVLSQAKFTFRRLMARGDGKPKGSTFGGRELNLLERPWQNGTTGQLLTMMEWHAGVTGNAYVTSRTPGRLRVLRPDWVAIVYGSEQEPEDAATALDGELLGYAYSNGGITAPGNGSLAGMAGNRVWTLLPDEVAHYTAAGLTDPEGGGIGMSWLTPALRDMQVDKAAAEHKVLFFKNAATPNMVVKGIPAMTQKQFDEIVDILESQHAGVRNAYKCLHPETEVAMWDGTRRRADEVSSGDVVVAWANGRAVPGTVSHADWQPPSAIVTVRTERGRTIKTNWRHPFLLRDGSWVDAIDLNRGDLLVTGLGWASDDVEDTITPHQAWVLGAIVGDGSTISSTPVLSAWDEGVRRRMAIGHELNWTGKGHDYRVLGVRHLCVAAGIMGKRSYEKTVPADVLRGSAKVRTAFVSGLIDTDGSFSDPAKVRTMQMSITSTSRDLLADVQHMLASLGVNASLTRPPSFAAGYPGGGGRRDLPRVRDAWRLGVCGNDQARRLVALLDLACAGKAERLAAYARTPSRQDRSRVDRVVSVEVSDAEPTIGLEIAEHHTHVTGGVVTHNTLYLTAGADATVVGTNFQQMDLKALTALGETRVSTLSRVPASLLGISEGLAGSSLNAGNFDSARRVFADTWVSPTLQDYAASLAPLVNVPNDAELWPDTSDMPILRDDSKAAAEITELQGRAIVALVNAGFEPSSVPSAVISGDLSLLKHSGLLSVQVQPPGQGAPPNKGGLTGQTGPADQGAPQDQPAGAAAPAGG